MKLFNTLSQKLETFTPRSPKQVTMYLCGITPYDTTHLGHAFTYVSFDAFVKYLSYRGYTINYTQNVTDINDRDNDMLKRAQEQGITWKKLARYWTTKFLDDMKKLNWTMPNHYLWASEQIMPMIEVIQQIVANGYGYIVNGGVYLDVTKHPSFGKLSRLTKEQMLKQAKEFEEDVENPNKRYPLDITLWRPTQTDQPIHIPSFKSPFGNGRPGWHIECSAMAIHSLGEQIDIHGGGMDLIYPHHESEIIQSETATKKEPFAKYWMHTALIKKDGKKMSKSLGNLVMVSDLMKTYSANAIRYLLLSHHYRSSWEFHEDALKTAEENIEKLQHALSLPLKTANNVNVTPYRERFTEAMDNDLQIPKALEVLQEMVKQNKTEANNDLQKALQEFTKVLGFVL